MIGYTLKSTNTYRVDTVQDALRLREFLEKTCTGELTSFTYTTKYIKEKGDIVGEYQVVKATIAIDNEKDPEGTMVITVNKEDLTDG